MITIVCTGWKIKLFLFNFIFLFMSKTVQMRHRKATRYRIVSSLKPSKTMDLVIEEGTAGSKSPH
jgi:hypothetical protein